MARNAIGSAIIEFDADTGSGWLSTDQAHDRCAARKAELEKAVRVP